MATTPLIIREIDGCIKVGEKVTITVFSREYGYERRMAVFITARRGCLVHGIYQFPMGQGNYMQKRVQFAFMAHPHEPTLRFIF